MSDGEPRQTAADRRRAFDLIWSQLPERQNRTSSSWWFFILFPEGEDGYGPRQLMFSVATRAGDRIRVNDVPLPGIDPDRTIRNGVDEFPAISVGWDGDDEGVDEHVVNHPADATLSPDGSLVAWADDADGARRGGEIRASEDRSSGLDAHFVGAKGEAQFEAWGDEESRISSPVEAMDVDTVAGGAHLVAWRRMQFEGEFDLPAGRETLEGLCYFQRVCLNVPLFPWKWVWVFFPDGSAFSVMIPYVGPQLLREGYRFFDSNALERATLPVQQSGMWEWGPSGQRTEFETVRVTPVVDAGPHPEFIVRARNERGDFVKFRAESYGHARNYIDRPVLGGRSETHWSYNEYLFRTEELRGRIGDEAVHEGTVGEGFGTLEYTWGLGL